MVSDCCNSVDFIINSFENQNFMQAFNNFLQFSLTFENL